MHLKNTHHTKKVTKNVSDYQKIRKSFFTKKNLIVVSNCSDYCAKKLRKFSSHPEEE